VGMGGVGIGCVGMNGVGMGGVRMRGVGMGGVGMRDVGMGGVGMGLEVGVAREGNRVAWCGVTCISVIEVTINLNSDWFANSATARDQHSDRTTKYSLAGFI